MENLITVENLTKSFPLKRGGLFSRNQSEILAVDRVSFEIRPGETFGVVGESGSGKTTLARLVVGLEKPTSGRISYRGRDITSLPGEEMKKLRLKMQMIFQDPYGSLDPRHNVLKIVAEPLRVHRLCLPAEIAGRVAQTLELVDLPGSDEFMAKMPDQLSGGQRQRVGIARALITDSEFIIGDEPVSMLDANVKAGIVALMKDLKRRIDLTYMFITHEIGLAYHICDRIAVMYLGRLVEMGPGEELIKNPRHPYTKMLMEAIPPLHPDPDWAEDIREGTGSPGCVGERTGCLFAPRCGEAEAACRVSEPALQSIEPEYHIACHRCPPPSGRD